MKILQAALLALCACATAPLEHESDSRPPISGRDAGPSRSFAVEFRTAFERGLAEPDVYVERPRGSGEFCRATTAERDALQPLFEVATVLADLVEPGPHARGEHLGITLGAWRRHRGAGTLAYADGFGTLDLSFSGLVPHGVYTIWQGANLDRPVGARDGSENVFRADLRGKARYRHTFLAELAPSRELTVCFHSDDETHGGRAGEPGRNVHRALFAILSESVR